MIAVTLSEQKKAKLKFFTTYVLSIILILFLFAYLWRDEGSVSAQDNAVYSASDSKSYVLADAFLHKKMQELDNLYASSINNNATSLTGVQPAEKAFQSSLDSLEREVAEITDKEQKNNWRLLLENFRSSFQNKSSLMNAYSLLQRDTSRNMTASTPDQNKAGNNTAAVEELKALMRQKDERIASLERQRQGELAEKDRAIVSLQNQLAQKPGAISQRSASDDSEWKQKYNSIKARHTELNTAYNTLSSSYQSVVADNRRLLNQLQQARKQ